MCSSFIVFGIFLVFCVVIFRFFLCFGIVIGVSFIIFEFRNKRKKDRIKRIYVFIFLRNLFRSILLFFVCFSLIKI